MLVWYFAMTTAAFALLAIYLSLRGEKKVKVKSSQIQENHIHVIVHELRAPLTAIKGAASLLLSQNLSEGEKQKMLHAISDSAREMLARISELLDSAKFEEGKFTIKKVKSDLYVILREHVDVLSYAARERGIELNFNPTDVIAQFYFDPGRIGQVINNLISNSLKFTNKGGRVDIKIALKAGRQGQEQDREIEVEISDNGVGIPEDKKALLFTKFGQIDHDGKGADKAVGSEDSSGLGLFISRQIIEAHGGKIWIESDEGKGTKVFFTLPLIQNLPN